MRRCYLVCYDIRHPKRLRQVHKTCKGYGEPWQFSIFFCVLKPIDRVRLQAELENVMNMKEDQVLLIDLGENEPAARKAAVTLGESLDEPLEGMVVI
jgi:CRISPR-associated protein Cas2